MLTNEIDRRRYFFNTFITNRICKVYKTCIYEPQNYYSYKLLVKRLFYWSHNNILDNNVCMSMLKVSRYKIKVLDISVVLFAGEASSE